MNAVVVEDVEVETPDLVPEFPATRLIVRAEPPRLEQRPEELMQVLRRSFFPATPASGRRHSHATPHNSNPPRKEETLSVVETGHRGAKVGTTVSASDFCLSRALFVSRAVLCVCTCDGHGCLSAENELGRCRYAGDVPSLPSGEERQPRANGHSRRAVKQKLKR